VAQVFGNAAAGADEAAPMILLNPPRKRWALRAVRPLMLMMMFPLSVLCAAMFTQPPIPQIEEVGRLVHISAK